MKKTIQFLIFIIFSQIIFSQTSKEYDDGHGKKLKIALGDIAFADSVISFRVGTPAPVEANKNPKLAVGLPDYDGYAGNFVSLGCGGELVLQFKDNALINIKGPDLYVFELGRYVEETILSISKDGKKWIYVGKINGGNAAVDLGDSINSSEIFRYVKLTDAKTLVKQSDSNPGADIDAVAAIGSAKSISLNSTFLFNLGQAILKPGAKKELNKIIEYLNLDANYLVRIEGHCDSTGLVEKNKKLSQDRANSVKAYIESGFKNKKTLFLAKGYSDEIPATSNGTAAGREMNRRVELFLIPLEESNSINSKK